MESESLVMIRCPQCGGLMVEGKECRACAGAGGQADGALLSPHAPVPTAEKKGQFPIVAAIVGILVVLLLAVGAAAVVSARGSDPLIEGWHKVQGRGVSLQLPEGWMGGEPGGEVVDQVLMGMRSYGPSYDVLARAIEANPDTVVLFAVNGTPGADGFATNVNAVAEEVSGDMSLEEYLKASLGMLPASFHVQESGVTKVGPHQAARFVTRFELPTGNGGQVAYIIKDGSVFWSVTYSASVAEFASLLPDFDRSAATIRLD
ncbi:MAG: hypothetical protein ACYC5Q_14395 [Thermoleophilia bacterium]